MICGVDFARRTTAHGRGGDGPLSTAGGDGPGVDSGSLNAAHRAGLQGT